MCPKIFNLQARNPGKLTYNSTLKASRPKIRKMFQSKSKDQKRPTSELNNQAFLLGLFILYWSSVDWMRPIHIGEGNLLFLVY